VLPSSSNSVNGIVNEDCRPSASSTSLSESWLRSGLSPNLEMSVLKFVLKINSLPFADSESFGKALMSTTKVTSSFSKSS